jgi:hypothetical protein
MRPSTRELISEVAARYGVTVEEILARCKPKRLLAARIEIAQALRARGYRGRQIGAAMNRDYTTAYFYLGCLAKKPRLKPLPPRPAPKRQRQLRGVDPSPRLIRYAGWDATEAHHD